MNYLRFLALIAIFPLLLSASPSESLWQEGLDALTANRSAEAIAKFQTWISEKEKEGVYSAEAHRNLSLAHWQEGEKENAVTEIVTSARLRRWPWQVWNDYAALSEMQREIGVPNSVSSQPRIIIAAATSENLITLLGFLVLWSLLTLSWIFKKPQAKPMIKSLATLAVTFCLVMGALLINKRTVGSLALVKSEESLALYKTSAAEDTEPVLELPKGTLILVKGKEGDRLAVRAPVPSWADESSLEILTF